MCIRDRQKRVLSVLSIFREPVYIEALAEQNLDIDTLDSLVEQGLARQVDSEIYDVHDLIREFLLRNIDDQTKFELHAKCSNWYKKSSQTPGYTIELIFHLLSSDNMAEAASMIVEEGRTLISQGHMELLGLIDSITLEDVPQNMLANIWQFKGEILSLLGRFEEAKLAFGYTQEQALMGKNNSIQAEALSALADISLKQGSLDESLIMHKEALEIFIKQKDAVGAARSYNNMGYLLRRKNDNSKAIESYSEVARILDENDEPVLEKVYSVDTGTVLTINTKTKKLFNGNNELMDVSSAFTPQKIEFMKAGGSYAIVFGKKLQSFAAKALGKNITPVFAKSKEVSIKNQGLTAVEKIFNKNAVGTSGATLHAGSYVRVEVNIVGSQDTTGLMTSQELEMMAATVISPIIDAGYQSGCHTASVWDLKSQENIPRLMSFMNSFGLITARHPDKKYHAMTDVIHKVLNDITVDDWAIIIGGDSHTRMSKGVAFGADSGTVALALATGEASMPIPESVKVTFKGKMKDHMDFRDVVHATQHQMLKKFNGENVFQGRIIEVHIGTLLADQAFTFTDWTAEMKAKASICISQDDTLIQSLNIAIGRIQIMIDKGMDNESQVLQGLIDRANKRIDQIKSGEKPPLTPDENAKYHAEFVVDLDIIDEPMIADPDVNNDDISKRYTHDTIREISYLSLIHI